MFYLLMTALSLLGLHFMLAMIVMIGDIIEMVQDLLK
jgi:hypothetical protein